MSRCAAIAGSAAQTSALLKIARIARLIATGCWRRYSLLVANMQQKYCDQGRSVVVLRITWPILRRCIRCAIGGIANKASASPAANDSAASSHELVIHL